MRRRFYRLAWAVTAAIALCISATGCGPTGTGLAGAGSTSTGSTPGHEKIEIVAAENFYGEVAQAVGGKYVQVVSILNNPNVDPHQYEPTPSASIAVQNAKIVVYNGIGYDDWMTNLLAASSGQRVVIPVAGQILSRQNGDNPHVWYIPSAMVRLASLIAANLGRMDVMHRQYYDANAKLYAARLQPLMNSIRKLRHHYPVMIAESEPVFDPMAKLLNLHSVDALFAKSIEDGNEPSPMDRVRLQNAITHHQIAFFVDNIQTDDPIVQVMIELCHAHHVPVVFVTETEPKGHNYEQWMLAQLRAIQDALPR